MRNWSKWTLLRPFIALLFLKFGRTIRAAAVFYDVHDCNVTLQSRYFRASAGAVRGYIKGRIRRPISFLALLSWRSIFNEESVADLDFTGLEDYVQKYIEKRTQVEKLFESMSYRSKIDQLKYFAFIEGIMPCFRYVPV